MAADVEFRPRLEIEQQDNGRTTCKVFVNDVLVFHGLDPIAEIEVKRLRDRIAELERAKPVIEAEALRNAAAAIQAVHPGEVKNSVVFLENLATEIEKGKS